MDIPNMMVKTIKIDEDVHARLEKIGNMGMTFQDVIVKLLNHYERCPNKK